jgi:hypothetical protein
VQVKDDTVLEDYEYFSVVLASPTNAILGNAREFIQIQNEEKRTLTVNNVSVVEGTVAKFTMTLAQRYYQPITISVTSHDGTAHAPGDYGSVTNKMITIPAGTTTKMIWIQTRLDGLTEPAETFTLTFSSSSINNSPRIATATIAANAT